MSRVPSRSASGVGLLSSVQRTARGAGDLGVIAFAVFIEECRELRRGEQQQARQRVERAARLLGTPGSGNAPITSSAASCVGVDAHRARSTQSSRNALLHASCRQECPSLLVSCLPRRALLGQREPGEPRQRGRSASVADSARGRIAPARDVG